MSKARVQNKRNEIPLKPESQRAGWSLLGDLVLYGKGATNKGVWPWGSLLSAGQVQDLMFLSAQSLRLLLPPRGLPDPEIEPMFLMSPALAGRFFTTSAIWETPDVPKGMKKA